MLGAEADGERLAFQRQSQAVQHGKRIPCAVADSKDQLFTGHRACCRLDAGQRTVPGVQAGQRRVEPHLAAQSLDLAADAADDAAQQGGADVGLPPRNVGGRAVVKERPCHERAQRVTDAGRQLAVREGARAALTKLNVGVGVQCAGFLKMLDGPNPFVQRGAALEHQRAVASAGQHQRREQARRAKTDDHWAMSQRRFPRCKVEFRRLCITDTGRGPGQCRFLTLVLECDCDGVDKHRRTVPGVHAEFCHTAVRRPAGGHAENGQCLRRCLGVRVGAGQRQADVAD